MNPGAMFLVSGSILSPFFGLAGAFVGFQRYETKTNQILNIIFSYWFCAIATQCGKVLTIYSRTIRSSSSFLTDFYILSALAGILSLLYVKIVFSSPSPKRLLVMFASIVLLGALFAALTVIAFPRQG